MKDYVQRVAVKGVTLGCGHSLVVFSGLSVELLWFFFTSDNWTQKWNALQVHAKFTGNTKLGGAIGCLEDRDTLQTEILKG